MTSPTVAKTLDDALRQLLAAESPLADRMDAYADLLRRINTPFAEAVDRLIDRLTAVSAGATAPQVGEEMPPFVLPDDQGQLVSLERLLAAGPLILSFRRGHWCPYCLLATNALTRIEKAAQARGARLAVITPEREQFTKTMKRLTGSDFPILSDLDNGYAMAIGLAISVGEEMRRFMIMRGRDLGSYHGNEAWILPIPATFVLDARGRIVMRHVDADYRRRVAVEDILSALDTLS